MLGCRNFSLAMLDSSSPGTDFSIPKISPKLDVIDHNFDINENLEFWMYEWDIIVDLPVFDVYGDEDQAASNSSFIITDRAFTEMSFTDFKEDVQYKKCLDWLSNELNQVIPIKAWEKREVHTLLTFWKAVTTSGDNYSSSQVQLQLNEDQLYDPGIPVREVDVFVGMGKEQMNYHANGVEIECNMGLSFDYVSSVRDEEGRRKFHGPFTGGYSAGYYNSVGSKKGWTPSTFTSSWKNRTELS
ncbi:hypothetical protein LIER_10245 [Lithospermum erythrorhizon]|uniref:G patch domain-containing protein n=1 Tax=Lithospermum erythrorhizon TaxID=34254 RepID=A0AAV3PJZ9_LITER